MSIGNLRDTGNKGNNFPYQLAALQLAGLSKFANLAEVTFSDPVAATLSTTISAYFVANPNDYLISKSVMFTGTDYVAFITVGTI